MQEQSLPGEVQVCFLLLLIFLGVYDFSIKWRQWGGLARWWVKVLAAEPDDLISTPELHVVERADSHKLSSDFCMSIVVYT